MERTRVWEKNLTMSNQSIDSSTRKGKDKGVLQLFLPLIASNNSSQPLN